MKVSTYERFGIINAKVKLCSNEYRKIKKTCKLFDKAEKLLQKSLENKILVDKNTSEMLAAIKNARRSMKLVLNSINKSCIKGA